MYKKTFTLTTIYKIKNYLQLIWEHFFHPNVAENALA